MISKIKQYKRIQRQFINIIDGYDNINFQYSKFQQSFMQKVEHLHFTSL
ncbi:hypothetical protein pb186bvf_014610 [Paramecium bursaria]